MRETWNRIERWLETNAPELREGLSPPLARELITPVEVELGYRFPTELVDSLCIHNGERGFVGSIYGLRLNALSEALDEYRVLLQLWRSGTFASAGQAASLPGLKPGHWNPGWVPLVSDGGGNSISIDFDPGEGGTYGQIFFFDHEQGPEAYLSPSFGAWLRGYADALETGKIQVVDGELALDEYL